MGFPPEPSRLARGHRYGFGGGYGRPAGGQSGGGGLERLVRCASMALILGSVLGTPAGLAAPPLQSPAPDAPFSEEPTTLPRCSDLGLAPQPAAGSAAGATTSAGVREAPSP